MARPEADPVLAGIHGSESEAPLGTALLVDDPMVVIEGLVDGDEESEVCVVGEQAGLGVLLLRLKLP